jgi:hypothetical protein
LRGDYPSRLSSSLVQGNVQFFGEFVGIERAASEIAIADFQRRNSPAAVILAKNDCLSFVVLLDIHFVKFHIAFFQEILDPATIWTPARAVDDDGFHALVGFDGNAAVFAGNLNTDDGSLQRDRRAIPIDIRIV